MNKNTQLLKCDATMFFSEKTIVKVTCELHWFIYFRHYRDEAALAEVNWRVKWEDIMFGAPEKRKLERSSSGMSLARVRRLTYSV